MKKSIIQDEKECFVTGTTENLHKHHIFGGAYRKNSEAFGLFVWLRYDWHNGADYGVHNKNRDLLMKLKYIAQEKAVEKYGWTKNDIICYCGANYYYD